MPVPVTAPAPADVRPDRQTDDVPDTGSPRVAHIVRTEPGESAAAKVTEARIYGTPVEALCGERFVPQRDPTRLPLCGACKEIYDLYRSFNEHLRPTPGS